MGKNDEIEATLRCKRDNAGNFICRGRKAARELVERMIAEQPCQS